jgi:hypothetical protein
MTALVASASAAAQSTNGDLKGFWQRGDAANWTAPVRENSSDGVVYRDYPLAVDKVKADTQAAVAVSSAPPAENTTQSQQTESNQPMSREQILAKFGAPDMPRPIRAAKDAPPEMQGLFAAINSGDKELAWQYSMALARRNTEIQKTVAKATDYQVIAAETLGLVPSTESKNPSESLNPNRVELQQYIERTKAELAKQQPSADIEAALAKTQGIEGVDAWAESDGTATAKSSSPAAQVPVDPEGKVKVLLFFDEKSTDAKSFSEAMRPLRERFQGDASVSIVGLTKRTYGIPGLKALGAGTNFPFPLINGEALAQELRIHTYPSVVFVAVTSKQTYRLGGDPSAADIERVVMLMKGSPRS